MGRTDFVHRGDLLDLLRAGCCTDDDHCVSIVVIRDRVGDRATVGTIAACHGRGAIWQAGQSK